MDYDLILEEISSFGPWQRSAFLCACAVSFANGAIIYLQTFTLFTPAFRCAVPFCDDGASDTIYNESFARFTIPFWEEDTNELESWELEVRSCERFGNASIRSEAGLGCAPSQFDPRNNGWCVRKFSAALTRLWPLHQYWVHEAFW